MKFKIQHLQAAVALVLASIQPQPKAVACQPTIVERVFEMGARVNKTDIEDLTAALNALAGDLRDSRVELSRYADNDFEGAVKTAKEIQSQTVHVAGIAESFVLMLPEKDIIMSYDKHTVEFAFVRAIKMVSIATKNYLSLIDQLIRTTDVRDSDVSFSGMNHLLDTGNKAAAKWH
ncbi:hypothetical protein O3W44_21420 [Pantoea sp. LMR881]|uniref:hypothetical protein n=1 Tax=Pantoea sp. LMR881 TaxID=3014336 RepID=UPI0022AE5F51|nr:hypothetical protein [Pantoea sp. LMR881]MCZ4061104.1 hypothetical protein [Pantoea sp. LMR881]